MLRKVNSFGICWEMRALNEFRKDSGLTCLLKEFMLLRAAFDLLRCREVIKGEGLITMEAVEIQSA